MNEIEFRAWQIVTRVMFYHIEKGTGAPDGNPPFADYLENSNMIVMQYTGMEDKKNKKIFQGDIVRRGYLALNDVSKFGLEPWNHLPEGVQESDLTTIVETWVVQWDVYDLCKLSEAVRSNPDVLGVEVIGNIYEHEALIPDAWKQLWKWDE